MAELVAEGPDAQDGADHGPAQQPFELLAPLTGGAPPARDLVPEGAQPGQPYRGEEHELRPRRRGVRGGDLAAGQVDQVMLGYGCDGGRHVAHRQDQAQRQVGPQHRPPARRRQPAVREDQGDQGKHDDHEREQAAEDDRHRTRPRDSAVAIVVHQRRVLGGADRERDPARRPQQQPADRVTGLMPRHDQAHRPDDQDHDQQADHGRQRARRQVVAQRADDGQGDDQHEHADRQEGRGARRGQAGPLHAGGAVTAGAPAPTRTRGRAAARRSP